LQANASSHESQTLNKTIEKNSSTEELANKTAVEAPVPTVVVQAQKNVTETQNVTTTKVNATTTSAIAQTNVTVTQAVNKTQSQTKNQASFNNQKKKSGEKIKAAETVNGEDREPEDDDALKPVKTATVPTQTTPVVDA